ncbi:MAG: alpha/beta hydrolase [Blastocatellia bacterium]|nr:alpha/beta hydrolase [Blastocatellia bacterium]
MSNHKIMSAITENFHQHQQAVRVPIWREVRLVAEWLQLRASPLLTGENIPRGNGEAIVTFPGFMCSDLYTACLTNWLQRIGYRAYPSGLDRNNDCLEKVQQQVSATIEKAVDETNGKVHLIGHSLGGVLARIAAIQRPEQIASVLTLASPFRGIRAHPYVLWLGRRVRQQLQNADTPHCFTGFCLCPSVKALQKDVAAAVPHCAVYTKTDGIVDWRACIHDDPLYNIEVSGTHCGLVFNRQVYELIAMWLKDHISKRA